MERITKRMIDIKHLDPNAHLELSLWTGQWLVMSNLHIGNGSILTGATEHRDTPEEAVDAFLERLSCHEADEYITNGRSGDERRNWRWTGVLFREVPTSALKREYAA